MIYGKRLFSVAIALLIAITASFTAYCANAVTLNDAQGAVEGIISYKCAELRADSAQQLPDALSEKAGSYSADWYYIPLSQYGIDCSGEKSVTALKKTADAFYEQDLENVRVTDMQRVALALVACAQDIKNIDGNNLLADCTYNRKNVKPLESQGINALAFALIVLDSSGYSVPADASEDREEIIGKILMAELENGGYALAGEKADPDVTAIVLQALAPYKDRGRVQEVIDRCIALLSDMQTDSGAFKSFGSENAESTAQVVTALTSLGINPHTDQRFIKGSVSALEGLMKFRLSRGGFCHKIGCGADNMATYQSLIALVSYCKFLKNQGRIYDFTADGSTLKEGNSGTASISLDNKKTRSKGKASSYNSKSEKSTSSSVTINSSTCADVPDEKAKKKSAVPAPATPKKTTEPSSAAEAEAIEARLNKSTANRLQVEKKCVLPGSIVCVLILTASYILFLVMKTGGERK